MCGSYYLSRWACSYVIGSNRKQSHIKGWTVPYKPCWNKNIKTRIFRCIFYKIVFNSKFLSEKKIYCFYIFISSSSTATLVKKFIYFKPTQKNYAFFYYYYFIPSQHLWSTNWIKMFFHLYKRKQKHVALIECAANKCMVQLDMHALRQISFGI